MFSEDQKITKRSIIYNIEPIGLGTSYVESLSSYISRLASYHCLTTGIFISKILAPYLNKYYLSAIAIRGGNGFFDSSSGVNGIGTLAKDFINLIQELNFRKDINKTTLIHWSSLLPTRGLMRENKSWCSYCYQDSLKNQTPVYDQLLWYIKEVDYCPKHDSLLELECPSCNKKQQILSRQTRPGYCQHCNIWLGKEIQFTSFNNINKAGVQVSQLIGEVLAYSSSEQPSCFDSTCISQSLNNLFKTFFNGNIRSMSMALDIPKTTISYWIKGINLVPLPSIIKVCLKLNITILELLEIKKVSIPINIPEGNLVVAKERKKYEYKDIKNILDRELKSQVPNSLKKVSEIIGCDRKLLYKYFPIESKLIVENRKKYIENQKQLRQHKIDSDLMIIMSNLNDEEEYPSRRKVESFLDNKYLLREGSVKYLWKKLKVNYTKY